MKHSLSLHVYKRERNKRKRKQTIMKLYKCYKIIDLRENKVIGMGMGKDPAAAIEDFKKGCREFSPGYKMPHSIVADIFDKR